MHKVVVERPRWNPGPGKNGRRANLPDELLPKFAGIKRPHTRRKGLTDLLGPLRRWLHSQLGRPWNAVYSEACAVIKSDSVIRAHIKTHLLEFVERHTFIHNRQVCVLDTSRRSGGIVPINTRRYGRSAFYVHPKTGLLQEIKRIPLREWRQAGKLKPVETLRWLDKETALQQINGLWFIYAIRVVSRDNKFKAYDHAAGKVVGRGKLFRQNGEYWHCITKRQFSRRELRHHGLTNVAQSHPLEVQPSVHRPGYALTVGLQVLQ